MGNEWMDQEVIYIVNLNHETKRNLEALEQEVDRRLKKKRTPAKRELRGERAGGRSGETCHLRRNRRCPACEAARRYASRAEKQILGFMILVLAGLTGLALTVTGHVIVGFAANIVAFLGLAISCHYE